MKKAKRISISILLFISLATLLSAEHSKAVLFISSYHPGFSTFFQQVEGLQDQLIPEGIYLDIEFMDTKRFPGEENWIRFTESLSYKLSQSEPYDLVITADDNALLFALQEKEGLLDNLPIVFLGVNNVGKALEMNEVPGITGIVEQVSMVETIDLMIDQNPDMRNLVVIVDGTPSGQGDLKTFWSYKERYPGYNFINLDLQKLSWVELSRELSDLRSNSPVLLLSAYFDKNGNVKSFSESLELITSSLSIPLYHLWYHGIGEGILGGQVVSHYEQGKTAGMLALKVLAGEDINEIKVVEKSPNSYLFDYEIIRRFKIGKSTIPDGSRILNEPFSFYKQYREEIIIVMAFLLILMAAISFLFFNLYRRLKAESSLSRLQEAVEQIIDTIEIYDLDHRLIYANPSFLKIHNLERHIVLGKKATEIFDGTSRENLEKDENLWKTVEAGVPWRGQFTNKSIDGSSIVQDVTLSPFYSEDGKIGGFISIKKDITELVNLMEERNTIQEHLYQAQKLESVGQLANGIAHDFNNILSGIMSAAQLILMPERQIDEKAKKYGKMIYTACERGADLVTKLMNFSQSNHSSVEPTVIRNLVDETVEILKHTIKKNISFSIEDHFTKGILNCDASSIQNALLNLGINSGHAIEKSGRIDMSITEKTLDRDYCYRSPYTVSPGRFCSITVSDSGSGIPGEYRDKIFEAFFTTKNKNEGTGLGLSSVKRIVEEHRGCIALNSVPGEGSTFEILIPLDLKALAL